MKQQRGEKEISTRQRDDRESENRVRVFLRRGKSRRSESRESGERDPHPWLFLTRFSWALDSISSQSFFADSVSVCFDKFLFLCFKICLLQICLTYILVINSRESCWDQLSSYLCMKRWDVLKSYMAEKYHGSQIGVWIENYKSEVGQKQDTRSRRNSSTQFLHLTFTFVCDWNSRHVFAWLLSFLPLITWEEGRKE